MENRGQGSADAGGQRADVCRYSPEEADDGVAYLNFYLEVEADKEKILGDVRRELEEMSSCGCGECIIEESQTEDVDWVNNWKQYFHQFYVDDILIIPSWEDVKPEDNDKTCDPHRSGYCIWHGHA